MPERYNFVATSPHPDNETHFKDWVQELSHNINMDIVPLSSAVLTIDCSVNLFGNVGVNRWVSSALETDIAPRHLQNAVNAFSMSIPRKGRLSIAQRREDDFAEGETRFLRLDERCRFRIKGDCELPGLFVPVPVLLARLPSAEDRILTTLSPHNPAFQLLAGYMEMVRARRDLDESTRHLVGEHLLDLVVHLLAPNSDRREAVLQGSLKEIRRSSILKYIEEHHSDPTLNLNTSVDRIGFSRTYIQSLLDDIGMNFSETLREARLDHARRMLSDRRNGHLSIATIAYDCGFSEISTFNRLFRNRFGDIPSAFRGERREV